MCIRTCAKSRPKKCACVRAIGPSTSTPTPPPPGCCVHAAVVANNKPAAGLCVRVQSAGCLRSGGAARFRKRGCETWDTSQVSRCSCRTSSASELPAGPFPSSCADNRLLSGDKTAARPNGTSLRIPFDWNALTGGGGATPTSPSAHFG